MSHYTPQPLPQTHDPKEKTSLTWALICLALGIVITIGALAETTVRDTLESALIGLAVILPSAWWLYCNNRDKQALARVRRDRDTHAYLNSVLTPDDAAVKLGMGAPPHYEPMQRHWIMVIALTAVLFGAGAALGSGATQENDSIPGGRGGTEFATCEEAWEHGQVSIPKDSVYYDIHLDEDKDGIACEK